MLNFLCCLITVPLVTAKPLLVLDALNKLALLDNFRTTAHVTTNKRFFTIGLSSIRAIDSIQFSSKGLLQVLTKIQAFIMIIDLRQESYGFIDSNAISWQAQQFR